MLQGEVAMEAEVGVMTSIRDMRTPGAAEDLVGTRRSPAVASMTRLPDTANQTGDPRETKKMMMIIIMDFAMEGRETAATQM